MSKAIQKIQALLNGNKSITLQGGSLAYQHGDMPTVALRETKRHRKITRTVVAVLDSDTDGQRVKDHCGEVWTVRPTGDGNFRALI